MRRILLLMSVALMLAAAMALSGMAQAKAVRGSNNAQCQKLAIQTLGESFDPSGYNFVGGTAGDDISLLFAATAGPDVFCGFGGNDEISGLKGGDIFLGGGGNDSVDYNNGIFVQD